MYKHMGKVVIKILQSTAVTLTTLGGLAIHPPVANFLQYIYAKNYENWLAVDKVIAKIIRLTFFGPPCIIIRYENWTHGHVSSKHVPAKVKDVNIFGHLILAPFTNIHICLLT